MALPLIIGALIKAGLPIIAGAVASKGKELVQEKLGVNLDDVLGTSEGTLQLKQLEFQHEEMLQAMVLESREQDIKETALYLEDTASARAREAVVSTSEHAPYLNKVIVPYLAIGILTATFGLFALLMFGPPMQDDSRETVIYILGVLSAISTQVVSYYFGTSAGSSAKNQTIASMQGSKK